MFSSTTKNNPKPLAATSFMGIKLNLFGKPEPEAHEPEEIVPLLPTATQAQPSRQKPGFFDNSLSENIANDTFVWQGDKIIGKPEAEKKEERELFYVLASKEHKGVYKLLREKEFLEFALKEINQKASSPRPSF